MPYRSHDTPKEDKTATPLAGEHYAELGNSVNVGFGPNRANAPREKSVVARTDPRSRGPSGWKVGVNPQACGVGWVVRQTVVC